LALAVRDAAEIAVFERVAVSFEMYYGIAGDLRRAVGRTAGFRVAD